MRDALIMRYFSILDKAIFSLLATSSLHNIDAISIAPPGENSLPVRATRKGHKTNPRSIFPSDDFPSDSTKFQIKFFNHDI